MFLEILAGLKACGYRVKCKVLDAQWLGVPQQRQRTIFVGVREDLNKEPTHPKPLAYRYSIRDALPWIIGATQDPKGQFGVRKNDGTKPSWTITTSNAYANTVEAETSIKRFAVGKEAKKLAEGEQSKKYMSLIRSHREKPSPCILASHGSPGIASVIHPTEQRKFAIAEIKRLCAFPDDFILTGSYAQQWERLGNSVPPVMMSYIARSVATALGIERTLETT